jgi:hypothetical protein
MGKSETGGGVALNPALREASFLVGDWVMELSGAAFLSSPNEVVQGTVRIELIEGGAFIALRQYDSEVGPPAARWVIGRDEQGSEYCALYADGRGVARVYAMTIEGGWWRIWRDAEGFSQRFAAAISEDRRTLEGRWEKSFDGSTWEHDFNLTYRRQG